MLAGVFATILAMVLLRYLKVKRPVVIFLAIGIVFTLLSLAVPLGADADTSTRWLLATMQIVAGVLILGALGYELNVGRKVDAAASD